MRRVRASRRAARTRGPRLGLDGNGRCGGLGACRGTTSPPCRLWPRVCEPLWGAEAICQAERERRGEAVEEVDDDLEESLGLQAGAEGQKRLPKAASTLEASSLVGGRSRARDPQAWHGPSKGSLHRTRQDSGVPLGLRSAAQCRRSPSSLSL